MKSRRFRPLSAAAALLALSLTAACGGGSEQDEDGAASAKPDGSATTSEGGDDGSGADEGEDSAKKPEPGGTDNWPGSPAKGRLSDDDLGSYALAQGDVPGFTVRIPSKSELSGMGEEKAKEAKCQPLAGLMAGTPDPAPADSVYRSVIADPEGKNPSGLILFETLAAYDTDGANDLFQRLRKAIRDCGGGFETTAKGEEGMGEYTNAKELDKPKLSGADDVIAFQLTGDANGQQLPILFNVIRTDSTVAVFYAMNLMDPSKAVIPDVVAATQTDKLT